MAVDEKKVAGAGKTLLDVFTEGAALAASLHAQHRGVQIEFDRIRPHLESAITEEFTELSNLLAEYRRGGPMDTELVRSAINTFCNTAGVKALKAAGYLDPQEKEG